MAKAKDTPRVAFSVLANGVMQWIFPDADAAKVQTVQFDPSRVPDGEVQEKALANGYKQKVADSAALTYKQPDGTFRAPTFAEKAAEMRATIANLYAGVWNAGREASGGFLFRAFQEWKPGRVSTVAEFDEMIEKMAAENSTKEKPLTAKRLKAAMEQSAHLKPIIERMRAEATADVDSDDILNNAFDE